ncbi:MAG: hypothetical protein EOO71_05550 [Myxococcaceae bacterium]|nr:MAG: hypothetical protein EOO71_05550 [Myxococcaceae bacterium]
MHSDHEARIASYSAQLNELLAAPSIKYSDWPPPDVVHLRNIAGVYHFYKVRESHIDSVYVGKGGFGKGEEWSLHARLKQHFQPSQKHTLLGKASRATEVPPEKLMAQFRAGDLRLQWLALGTRSDRENIQLERELLWFECFAIAVLRPMFTDEG